MKRLTETWSCMEPAQQGAMSMLIAFVVILAVIGIFFWLASIYKAKVSQVTRNKIASICDKCIGIPVASVVMLALAAGVSFAIYKFGWGLYHGIRCFIEVG